ncbi:glutamate--cysteine ligase [Xanthomonas oryzae]|uniref:glutamate--cysteine ligase n=1 Tax=Xanthomonas oryzae TaxID=347 RepID=UPI000949E40A|nr:glutamate-cysteine ligase family protein [Xanthomonas oryzae]OLG34809.1 glutamate--cysteine ligase [Xanthomonas oryzae pv. oryzae]QGN63160.1 glutamate--cysteine ligase [Xanthomonas oryzae pv. oryzae]URQ81337.1 glutamate-cysteine ligase family protein [Xanthomonas oryzae pv. oryzae]
MPRCASGRRVVAETPITERAELVHVLASGEKPEAQWRIGTEHEQFGFRLDDLRPPTFDGERGIEASVTLEPAGQLELSGAPLHTIHDTCVEVGSHLNEVKQVADQLGLGFLGMGFQPKWSREAMPLMPQDRHKIMQAYMPNVGALGLDMMTRTRTRTCTCTRTCTVQVNLDYASEADMVKKFRVSLALQPIATALFADSPFTEGKPNGYLSYRSHIWIDTDADRTGILDFVFEDGFGYERYLDYLLDVPMYFSYHDGTYIDASGQSFRDFLRGADARPWGRLCALSAFWVGLLYDDPALDAAWDLVKDFSRSERHALRDGVPRHALKLPFRNDSVQNLATEAVKIALAGLRRRARLNRDVQDESRFLEPLVEILHSGETAAERKLALYHGVWQGDIDRVFGEFAY